MMADMVSQPDAPPNGQAPFTGHILLDIPASDPAFGFKDIARALAQIIQESEPRFAVGIFGSWGCGKSTLMDAIATRIDRNRAIVVPFNAWRYEREPHLILPLLDTIRASLLSWANEAEVPESAKAQAINIARRIGRVVRALARGFSAEIGLPGTVALSFDTGKAIDALSPESDDVARAPQSLYYAAFQELTTAFHEVEQATFDRIVVFVDDLDRCLPMSALTVLESMKLFFDMPGFVFVVGMDEEVIERAVSAKFADETRAAEDARGESAIEREYVKKIFQVPYTIPMMAPGDLDRLLQLMEQQLGDAQRDDLRSRVRRYIPHVAPEGRVNPREVKRFVNAYTLQRMIRPSLDPDTVLALQTLEFRRDWEDLYDVLLSEPRDFVDALRRYRDEDDVHSFENIWPQLAVLPVDLADYLRSDEAGPLTAKGDLERYVSSLQSARSTQPWLHDAIRDVGQLRRAIRKVPARVQFGSKSAREAAEQMQTICSRIDLHKDPASPYSRLAPHVQRMRDLLNELVPSSIEEQVATTTEEQVATWRARAQQAVDALHQELRLMRRASAFGPP